MTRRIALLSPVSRTRTLEDIRAGKSTDTVLLGANHLDGVDYLTIGEYHGDALFTRFKRRLPRALQRILMVPTLCRYDVVIAQDDLFVGYLVSLFGRRTRWFYVAINTSILIRRHAKHPLRRALLKLFWSSFARIICIAREQMRDLVALGVPSAHLRFVPYCIDTRFFARSEHAPEEPFVVSVGRDAGRDFPTLFKVAEKSSYQFFILTGEKNIPKGTRYPQNVTVLYNQGNEKARELYARAFAAAIVSKDAHIPDGSDCSGQTVILEALAAGKAVVATQRPWIEDYLEPGKDLIVVAPGDDEGIRHALDRLWSNEAERRALANAGQKKVIAEFDTRQFAKALERLMEETDART